MGSDAQTVGAAEAPMAPEPQPMTPPPAAAGGGKGMMIAVAVVVIVVVAAVFGYMMFMGGNDGLTGKWTVSGGEMSYKMVVNNDTANAIEMDNIPIPADTTTVIDFDDDTTMPEGMKYVDLGNGNFKIEGFEMMGAEMGTITGTYTISGDTLTIKMNGSGTYIDGTDYYEIEFDQTVTFARA